MVRSVTIPDFRIDQPALLENNCKIAKIGGGGVNHGVKNQPLFVHHLSVFMGVLGATKS
jgi:hypothetical protein